MTVTCPKCGQLIAPASINVAQDVALCASCDEVFKVSALLTAPPRPIVQIPAGGRTKSKAIPIAIAGVVVVIITALVLILMSAPEEDYDPSWLTEEEFAAPQTAVVEETPQMASQPASGSAPPVSASFAGAEYSGTMVQDRTVLNIQMVIGGFKDGEAVNTYYLYIEQDIPIPLTGSLDGEELILLEAEDSGFFFPHFDPAYTSLTGMWTGSSGDYAVTLTRK
jgi:hypothetical protein